MLKTDSIGDTLWTRLYFTPTGGDAYHVQETKSDEYIIVGTTNPVLVRFDNNPRDLWLIKTKQDGDTLWTRFYGEGSGDIGYCVQESEDNGYLITGVMNDDLLLIKTDSLGLLSITEEPMPQDEENWELLSVIGEQIALKYTNRPQGFKANIYNTLGQKIDELNCPQTSGIIMWGQGRPSGVYFIKPAGNTSQTKRVIILH